MMFRDTISHTETMATLQAGAEISRSCWDAAMLALERMEVVNFKHNGNTYRADPGEIAIAVQLTKNTP